MISSSYGVSARRPIDQSRCSVCMPAKQAITVRQPLNPRVLMFQIAELGWQGIEKRSPRGVRDRLIFGYIKCRKRRPQGTRNMRKAHTLMLPPISASKVTSA
jgi:hypothetical protein